MTDSPRLSQKARDILTDGKNKLYYSAASLLEIGELHTSTPAVLEFSAEEFHSCCQESGAYDLINITENDIFSTSHLTRKADTPPHSGMFGKLMLAQAINRNMHLMTHDFLLTGYEYERILYV